MLIALIILFVFLVFLVCGTALKVTKKQRALYAYDVKQDYQFQENTFTGNRHEVQVMDGTVEFPVSLEETDSAFLKIAVKTTGIGKYREPTVMLTRGDRSFEQCMERGAKGIRYLNVSPLLKDSKGSLILEGKDLVIPNQLGELITFKNKVPKDSRVLVIAPHPDDAEIAAYGMYSDIKDTFIVTVSAGDGGPQNFSQLYTDMAAHYLKKGQVRTWNSITVPMLCGIPAEQTVNLGFFDGTFKKMHQNKSVDVPGVYTGITDINTYRKQNSSPLAEELGGTANWTSLVDNLSMLVSQIKPDFIVTPHPLLDSQEDHKYISLALFEAIRKSGLQEGLMLFYANHYAFNEYFPYGKQGSLISLPPNFSEAPYFSSVYSHTLSEDKQRDKMFSLEAMHDLRLNTDRHFAKDATAAAIKGPVKELLGFDDTYYRRSVRCNELFFTVPINELYNEDTLNKLSKTEW